MVACWRSTPEETTVSTWRDFPIDSEPIGFTRETEAIGGARGDA